MCSCVVSTKAVIQILNQVEQKEGAASLCIFLYLCTDGWASAIRARVCIHSAINVECGVLLGDAADVELTLFTRMKLQRSV